MLSCTLLLLTALTQSNRNPEPIQYQVTPASDFNSVKIDITVPCSGETIDVIMPNWTPGYYVLENYGQTLDNLTAAGEDGEQRPISHPKPDTWHIDTLGAQSITVSYTRAVAHQTGPIGMFSSDSETIHYGGPSTYLYVSGRNQNPCTVEFKLPPDWKISVGLDPITPTTFIAKNYDALADNPVTMGNFRTANYQARSVDHLLAVRGPARDKLDLTKTLKMTQFITESATDFLGGTAPYSRYVWHIWAADTRDGAGGLEHATSSQDFLSIVQGPASVRGMTHEYFHLWNVKRIRSAALGPFDYSQLPRTGALWWLEGVTDYYASLIPHRYGWYGDEEYLTDIASNISAIRSRKERLTVSPFESSNRVAETSNGRGNSNGFGVDYYPTGWVLGMLLDIEIRARTNNAHSLDDVEFALFELCKDDKPGFEEGELRRQIIKFGGSEMASLFDKWVMQPGELPVEQTLAKVGLQVSTEGNRTVVSFYTKATDEQVQLREKWFFGKKMRPTKLLGTD